MTTQTETYQLETDKNRDDPQIFEAIINFFTSYNWTFSKLAEASILQLRFQGENGEWECYAKAREEENQFVFYSICPVKVPKPKRRAVGEYIARANYGTISGNFELDFADGEIRYKTSIDLEDIGEEGEKRFEEAYKLFMTSQFDAKQVRFIRDATH